VIKISVHLIFTIQSSGAQRLFEHSVYGLRPYEACFQSEGALTIKWTLSKCPPWLPTKALKETDFWDPTFFHHVRLGAVYQDFQRNVLPKLLQNVDLQTAILLRSMHDGAAPYYHSCISGILEQPVAGTTERTRWNNSKACSFPWLQPLLFLSPGISAVYCLCYRSHWRPGLSTTDTEWIRDD